MLDRPAMTAFEIDMPVNVSAELLFAGAQYVETVRADFVGLVNGIIHRVREESPDQHCMFSHQAKKSGAMPGAELLCNVFGARTNLDCLGLTRCGACSEFTQDALPGHAGDITRWDTRGFTHSRSITSDCLHEVSLPVSRHKLRVSRLHSYQRQTFASH